MTSSDKTRDSQNPASSHSQGGSAPLTSTQLAFAEVLGKALANKWRAEQCPGQERPKDVPEPGQVSRTASP